MIKYSISDTACFFLTGPPLNIKYRIPCKPARKGLLTPRDRHKKLLVTKILVTKKNFVKYFFLSQKIFSHKKNISHQKFLVTKKFQSQKNFSHKKFKSQKNVSNKKILGHKKMLVTKKF